MAIKAEPGRFSDGRNIDQEAQWSPTGDIVVRLERTVDLVDHHFLWHHRRHSKDRLKVARRIAYRVRQTDKADEFTVIVPADTGAFRSHMKSVQTLFAWLIPTSSRRPWQTELIYGAARAVAIPSMWLCNIAERGPQWLASRS